MNESHPDFLAVCAWFALEASVQAREGQSYALYRTICLILFIRIFLARVRFAPLAQKRESRPKTHCTKCMHRIAFTVPVIFLSFFEPYEYHGTEKTASNCDPIGEEHAATTANTLMPDGTRSSTRKISLSPSAVKEQMQVNDILKGANEQPAERNEADENKNDNPPIVKEEMQGNDTSNEANEPTAERTFSSKRRYRHQYRFTQCERANYGTNRKD